MEGFSLFKRPLIALSLALVFLLLLAVPAFGWHATADCQRVHLVGGHGALGRTTLVFEDHSHQTLTFDSHEASVANNGAHGRVVKVRFSNGEKQHVPIPEGCTSPTTVVETTTVAPTTTTVAASPVTGSSVPETPVTVISSVPAELPRTGSSSAWTLTFWGGIVLLAGLTGVCLVGNRNRV